MKRSSILKSVRNAYSADIPANGVRSLAVSCWQCHHRAILSADSWPDNIPVPSFGPCMVCTRCGIVGADARPNWREQPARRSGAGTRHREKAMVGLFVKVVMVPTFVFVAFGERGSEPSLTGRVI